MSSSAGTVCPHYLQGSCRRGKSCKFKHQTPKSPVCTYFLRGSCAYGDNCTRQHKRPPKSPKSGTSTSSLNESKEPETNWNDATDAPEEQSQGKNKTDDIGWGTSLEEGTHSSPKKKSPCVFYNHRICGNGDQCEFAHITSSSNESGKDFSDGIPASSPPRKKSEATICKNFMRGSCRAGDACRLRHMQSTDMSYTVAGSESSDGPAEWDHFDGPQYKAITGISASGGPEAEDQDIPSYGDDSNVNANDMMHLDANDSSDDIYGDVYDDAGNGTDDLNHQYEGEEASYNAEADTTLKDNRDQNHNGHESGYSSAGPAEESRRGHDWDESSLVNPSSSFRAAEPPQLPRLVVPQPVQATPLPIPGVQPHWSQFADPKANAQIAFCKPHAQGLCPQGPACRFRHFLTPEEYTLLFHDPQPNLWTFQISAASTVSLPQAHTPVSVASATVTQGVVATNHGTGTPKTPSKPSTSTFAQECKFYRLGTCRNAERCPYAHNQHPPTFETAASANTDQEWGSQEWNNSPRNSRDKFDAPCRFYVQNKHCNRGKDCKFRHDNSITEKANHSQGWGSSNDGYNAKEADNAKADPDQTEWDPDAARPGWGDTSGWDIPAATKETEDTSWGDAFDAPTPWNAQPVASSSAWNDTPASYSKKNVCYQFQNEGSCRRGSDCRYSHDVEPGRKFNSDERPIEDQKPFVEERAPSPTEHNSRDDDEFQDQGEYPDQEDRIDDGDPPEDEPHWTVAWGLDKIPTPAPGSKNEPCSLFSTGALCPYGDNCAFLHTLTPDVNYVISTPFSEDLTDRPDSPLNDDMYAEDEGNETRKFEEDKEDTARDSRQSDGERETEDENEPIVHSELPAPFLDQCTVKFGQNIVPATVITLADSNKVVLTNLRIGIEPEEITELTGQYGEITQTMNMGDTISSAVVEVQFEEASQAYKAFYNLHDHVYQSREVSAILKGSRSRLIKRTAGQKIYWKISWPKPHRRAWSHYPTISKAKQQANDLNNIIIRGRAIASSFVTPKKAQKSSFAVLIQNLDPETTTAELKAVCTECELVTMDPPIFEEDASDKVRAIFEGLGIDSFDMLPVTHGAASTALLTFQSEYMAMDLMKRLKARRLEFLGNEPLIIQNVHYARYFIAKPLFEVVKAVVGGLIEQSEGPNKCTIQYNEISGGQIVSIHIYSSFDNATFADTNSELRSILQGVHATSGSKTVWDDYFETSSGSKALKNVESQTGTLIKVDLRNKRIRIFGRKDGQAQAQALIAKVVSKVQDARHEIDLPRYKLHPLVSGAFSTLQDSIGAQKVSLDVVNSKLIVLGAADEVSKANDAISMLESPSSASSSRNTCQICQHSAVALVLLSCRHAYCTTCLKFAIKNKGSPPFQCIAQHPARQGDITKKCSEIVSYSVLHDVLTADDEKDILRATFNAYVRSNSDELFFCPSLDCASVHRVRNNPGVNVNCTYCKCELCTYCKSWAHIGMPCPLRV
ncbi:hypothetical protein BDN70DRAFT_589824 [Pholiota conissans]|uniref:C3H1-type domain-containing protein n=1 Tax=Pholiota conissans TaxID=109636 RepID=A0A9P5ZGJ3_9AGAR|nr:hypothetical protein BDN70DRAFT_589824 [Pholiota conissans]